MVIHAADAWIPTGGFLADTRGPAQPPSPTQPLMSEAFHPELMPTPWLPQAISHPGKSHDPAEDVIPSGKAVAHP